MKSISLTRRLKLILLLIEEGNTVHFGHYGCTGGTENFCKNPG